MGFGILLIGYFFLFNITYFTLTDILAAVLMLLALSSLSRFNKPMKWAYITDGVFCVISFLEFLFEAGRMFSLADTGMALSIITPVRYLTLAVFNVFLLLGIRSLATEVGLEKLANQCAFTLSFPTLVYLLSALLEVAPLFSSASTDLTQYVALLVLLLTVVSVILVLLRIWNAYMRICMPEDVDMEVKPSRFAFINRFREKQAQREQQTQEELARIRAQRVKRRMEKQKRKKK